MCVTAAQCGCALSVRSPRGIAAVHRPRQSWIVDNEGDVYTVDRVSFRRTYRQVGPGAYVKVTPVWAEKADAAGRVETKEGSTGYKRGDYLVFNEKNGADAYAVSAKKFKRMYVRAK